jgi:chromate transporter
MPTPILQNILGGLSSAAAGLMIATGIRLLMPHRSRQMALLFAALAFTGMVVVKLPLLIVLFGLAPISIAVARQRELKNSMKDPTASLLLAAHLALLSSISFGGFPTVLPDVRNLVTAHGWVTDQEFANFFAISQVVPGPNMILMMSFVGLKVGGILGAITSAFATFGPPCLMYYTSYRLWDRFRDRPWQQMVRRGLAPLTIGLVIAGGYVMA